MISKTFYGNSLQRIFAFMLLNLQIKLNIHQNFNKNTLLVLHYCFTLRMPFPSALFYSLASQITLEQSKVLGIGLNKTVYVWLFQNISQQLLQTICPNSHYSENENVIKVKCIQNSYKYQLSVQVATTTEHTFGKLGGSCCAAFIHLYIFFKIINNLFHKHNCNKYTFKAQVAQFKCEACDLSLLFYNMALPFDKKLSFKHFNIFWGSHICVVFCGSGAQETAVNFLLKCFFSQDA